MAIDYTKWLEGQRDSSFFDRSMIGQSLQQQEADKMMEDLQNLQGQGQPEVAPELDEDFLSSLLGGDKYDSQIGEPEEGTAEYLYSKLYGPEHMTIMAGGGLKKIASDKAEDIAKRGFITNPLAKLAGKHSLLKGGAKLGARFIPGLGWGLLAADAMDYFMPEYSPYKWAGKGYDWLTGGDEENLVAEAMKNEGQ